MRQEKQLLLDEIKDQIDQFDAFVIMSYLGLDANVTNDFRRDIAQTGGSVEMVPKRLLIKAAEKCGVALDYAELPGHVGLVFAGPDAIETTKIVFRYRKETEKAINVLGGRFDGALYPAEDVETLSKLPGKDQMRAQLLSVLQAPLAETVGAMNALLTCILYCLENKAAE